MLLIVLLIIDEEEDKVQGFSKGQQCIQSGHCPAVTASLAQNCTLKLHFNLQLFCISSVHKMLQLDSP